MSDEPPRRLGRPPGSQTAVKALSPEVHKKLVHSIQVGLTVEDAATMAGVDKRTVYMWMKKGHKETEGVYYNLAEDMGKALIECKYLGLSRMQKLASEGSYQATTWLLEKRFPNEFGNLQKVELSGRVDTALTLDHVRAAAELAMKNKDD